MTHGKARHRGAALLLGACAVVLAGCGSDTGKTEGVAITRNVLRGIVARFAGTKGDATAAPQVSDDQLAAAGLASFPGPLMLAKIEVQGATTLIGLYGENGAMRTYAAPNEQSIILRNGMLAGTRGLGRDLMSADTAAAAAVIRSRRAGNAEKTLRYLDGEGRERPLPLSCAIRPAGTQSYDLAGKAFSGTQMLETCTGLGLSIESSYLVTAQGDIVASRQWIGPVVGHVVLQTVRP
jgi:hypothetical protein